MKTLLIIAITALPIYIVKAQDPCATHQYPYAYMDKDCNLVYHCANNPNTENSPDKIIRWPDGSTIQYATNVNNLSSAHCVNWTGLNTCIDNAFCSWTKLCGSEPPLFADRDDADYLNDNVIPIRYVTLANGGGIFSGSGSSATHEFGDTKTARSTYAAYTHIGVQCPGTIASNNPANNSAIKDATTIDINGTSDYTAANTDFYPCPPNAGCATKGQPEDLCKIITHEIGHLFGLQHTVRSPDEERGVYVNPPLPICSPHDDNSKDLMSADLSNKPCDGTPPFWSTNDICEYRKLYCYGYHIANKGQEQILDASCTNSNVSEPHTFDPALFAYPNPTTGSLTVEYTSDRVGMVAVGIFDVLGNQMLTTSYREQAGRDTHTLDLSALPAGHYIVRVLGANLRGSRSVILTGKR